MKPLILTQGVSTPQNVIVGHVPAFNNTSGSELYDSNINAQILASFVDAKDAILDHINNEDYHVSMGDREKWNRRESISDHMLDNEIHVTRADRENWDNKETVDGAQAKVDAVMESLNTHIYNQEIHVTQYEKNRLTNTYTKEEIESLLSQFESNITWKPPVNAYEDLDTTYPDPRDGWTVNILEDDLTYRYDGEKWVCISANYIPLATATNDGKMSKEDKFKLDTIAPYANNYIHPVDEYTRHVTDNQIAKWSSKADDIEVTYTAKGLMISTDKIKLDGIEEGANNYVHPSTHSARIIDETDDLQFVSATDKEYWNAKANNILATQYVDGIMSKEDKLKIDSVEQGANRYVHPATHNPDMIEQTADKQFVSGNDKLVWNAKFGRGDFVRGSAVFNGRTGVKVDHGLGDYTKLYNVIITVTSNVTPDLVGTISVVKEPDYFMVYSSGDDIGDTFDYVLIKQ